MTTTFHLPEFKTNEVSNYHDTDRVAVECVCGLVYLGGSGGNMDPLMSAKYNPITGKLESCRVCEYNHTVPNGLYYHRRTGDPYVVIDVVTDKTTETPMVLYKKLGTKELFVRTVDNFRERFASAIGYAP